MQRLYDRAEIYDLFESEYRYNFTKKHWETILAGKEIRSFLDVSIGSGTVTLPLADLGFDVSGSDLSEAMLARCREKAAKHNHNLTLKCADFRNLGCWEGQLFDCVASTGNSLPYVSNEDVGKALREMDTHVRPGGYLYLDVRNWDRMLKTKQRFYVYDPVFHDGNRVNVVQFWDYHPDGTMTFNILFSFEKDGRIFQKEIFEEHYMPISKRVILEYLAAMGYSDITIRPYPSQRMDSDLETVDWYCVIARKE